MAVIRNKWIEKEKKKRALDTAPAFQSVDTSDDWKPVDSNKPVKRFTNAANGTMKKTLRGVRK